MNDNLEGKSSIEEPEEKTYSEFDVECVIKFLTSGTRAMQWGLVAIACIGWSAGALFVYFMASLFSVPVLKYCILTTILAQLFFGYWCCFKYKWIRAMDMRVE